MIDLLVNKENLIDKKFIPTDLVEIKPRIKGSVDPNRKILLVSEAWIAFSKMKEAALLEGMDIDISSGYRSYSYQEKLFKYNVELIGLEETKKKVALPGTSDHHTGLALDYYSFRTNEDGLIFPYTDIKEEDREYQWIKDNCYKYGYIVRYPKGKEHITGYIFEPWHLRYVGLDIAKEIYYNNITLEEYVGKKKRGC